MKKAVMYGGGNIGRGFIGMLLSRSGYEVTFVDVAAPVVDTLNKARRYPVRILSGDSFDDIWVENVCAVNGNDQAAVARAIADADIMATAVGVNILKFIIANLVAGIRLRMQEKKGPLNIIIRENLMDANKILEGMLKEHLTEEEQAWFDENIGLVEASIGRMVPVQTEEMKDGEPLRVCVESYGFLPVDKDAFKGGIPEIQDMVPFSPFDFYLKRKLYIHNMGHATCAYLGDLFGLTYIYEAIDRDDIYIIVKGAMEQSAQALSKKYGVPVSDILPHISHLLHRFTNRALKDTCQRVGGDPRRKLSPEDRLIGSGKLSYEMGIMPTYIAIGAAAGLKRYLTENDLPQTGESARQVLTGVSDLSSDHPLFSLIGETYDALLAGSSIGDLRRRADKITAATTHGII